MPLQLRLLMETKSISPLCLTYTHRYRRCAAHTRKHSHIHPLYTHTAWISASRLPFSLSPHIFFVALGNVFSVDDDDKAMLLLLEISHPALFTDRCHGIMATLNCQHLVKRIEAWWRFYLSCLCSSCWPINVLKTD